MPESDQQKLDFSAQFKNWSTLTPEEQGVLGELHIFVSQHQAKTLEDPLVSLSRPGSKYEGRYDEYVTLWEKATGKKRKVVDPAREFYGRD